MYPERYTFLTGTSVNGSSPTGKCSNVSMAGTMTTCLQPTSSVLFDGRVPTLTGLDGDMWASQLLTIQTTQSVTNVIFDFTDTPGYDRVKRVEVVMFNCPQWGIASTDIHLSGATARGQPFNTYASTTFSSLTSCDSFVRVCLLTYFSRPVIGLKFFKRDSNWVHLAEVTFYSRGSTCPPNIIFIPPSPTTPPVTTAPVTTPPVTTAPVTTPPVTTPPVTTPPVTTPPVTTPPVTTPPVTTPPVTTPPVTTPPVTTPPVTTPPVTTAPGTPCSCSIIHAGNERRFYTHACMGMALYWCTDMKSAAWQELWSIAGYANNYFHLPLQFLLNTTHFLLVHQ